MEPRNEAKKTTEPGKEEKKRFQLKRFQIVKLEERITPTPTNKCGTGTCSCVYTC